MTFKYITYKYLLSLIPEYSKINATVDVNGIVITFIVIQKFINFSKNK